MSPFRKFVVALLAAVALFGAIGLLLERHVHVERAIVIDAPRETVFALLCGYRQSPKWSPWAALDDNAKFDSQGVEFGVGAKQSWTGHFWTVGSGREDIIEIRPLEMVKSHLERGVRGPATATFVLAPDGNGTRVTWSLDADSGARPIGRYSGLLLKRFAGSDVEKGLANLKRLAESLPKDDFSGLPVVLVDAPPVSVAYVETQSSKDAKDRAAAIGAAYAKIGAFMNAYGLAMDGWPILIDTRVDDTGYGFEVAIPLAMAPGKEIPADSPVKVKSTYGGMALKVFRKGSDDGRPRTYAKLRAYMAVRGYESAGASWDEYIGDPRTMPDDDLVTYIYQPVK